MMAWIQVVLVLLCIGGMMVWLSSGPEFVERKKEPPILDRKARFKLYVQGERQLMADWEAAFDPQRSALKAATADDYFAKWAYPKKLGGQVWWEEMQLDRDQCKLEADAMLGRALITEQEYGPRIARCN